MLLGLLRKFFAGREGLKRIDHRGRSEDLWEYEIPGRPSIRVARAIDGDRVGVAASWPSKLTARELVRECVHRNKLALGDGTDIVTFVPDVGSRPYLTSFDAFVADSGIDDAIVRFNTPTWSMMVWPAGHSGAGLPVVEYTTDNPDGDLLRQVLEASLIANSGTTPSKTVDEIKAFHRLEPLSVVAHSDR